MTLRSSVVEPIKRHLHDRLPKMCDADPDALSSYILALLQRDQPMDALRESCQTELEEFLGHQTSQFVAALFNLIADLSTEGTSSSSSHKKRHHEGIRGSSSRGSAYPYESKRNRNDDRFRHQPHRRSSNEFRGDDYGRPLLDVPPPPPSAARHYDDRRGPMPRHPYNEYRSPVPSSSPPYMSRIRPQSPPVMNPLSPPPRPSSRWPTAGSGGSTGPATPANGQTPPSSSAATPQQPHHDRKPPHGGERQQNDHRAPQQQQQQHDQRPRSPTNLMIANVPRELNNLAALGAHFARFGEIVNIQIKANANRAFIQYRTHEQARRALSCPEAVCNNRFIKVLWARYDPMDKESKLTVDGDGAPSILDEQILLLRQQEKEAQVRRDRLQLKSDVTSKTTLCSKLKSMTGENAARQAQIEKLEGEIRALQEKLDSLPAVEDVPAPPATAGDGVPPPSIQEQLAQAEKEAAAIGLVDEFGNIVYGKAGRGGSVRGRRGGRGGGGGGHDVLRRMSLDNRPKTLAVRAIPEQFLNEKMIRSHFQSFGELGRVVLGALGEPTSALVEFKTRNQAQMALSQGQSMLKHLLQLDWHEGKIETTAVVGSVAPSESVSYAEPNNVHDGISDDDDDEDVDRSWKR